LSSLLQAACKHQVGGIDRMDLGMLPMPANRNIVFTQPRHRSQLACRDTLLQPPPCNHRSAYLCAFIVFSGDMYGEDSFVR
jgi:hypothetical protein